MSHRCSSCGKELPPARCPKCFPSPGEAHSEEWAHDFKTLYHDLLMSVGNKYPGETRHQTAKRYILQAEWVNSGEAQQASQSDKEEGK